MVWVLGTMLSRIPWIMLFWSVVSGGLYYKLSGATHGPFTLEQLEGWYRDGYFQSDMPVSEDAYMGTSVPISRLFDDQGPGGDYSDDEVEGRGFSVSGAREAAERLASMDMRQYKERASEVATDLRYAAADGVNKAKEIGSFLSIKMADKLQGLRQKVKESTGISNPGYASQNQNQYDDQPYHGQYDQQYAHDVQHAGPQANSEYMQQPLWPEQGAGQVGLAQAGYDNPPSLEQQGGADHADLPVPVTTGGENDESSGVFEAGPVPDRDSVAPALTMERPVEAGSSEEHVLNSEFSYGEGGGKPVGHSENIYEPLGPISVEETSLEPLGDRGVRDDEAEAAFRQDSHYSILQQQQEQPDWPPENQHNTYGAAPGIVEPDSHYYQREEQRHNWVDDDHHYGGFDITSTSFDDSDDEDKFAGLSVSEYGTGLNGAFKRTRRAWRKGLKQARSTYRRFGSYWARRKEKGEDYLVDKAVPAPAHGAPAVFGRKGLWATLVEGSRSNAQLAMTGIRQAPMPFLGLLVSLPMMPSLFLLAFAGVPASVQQLVLLTDPEYQSTGEIMAFPGRGLLMASINMSKKVIGIVPVPGATSLLTQLLEAVERAPSAVVVLLLIQRIAVIALTVIPALVAVMGQSVARIQQEKREKNRGYVDPLDSAIWALAGRIRFCRLTEALSLLYLPLTVALSTLLIHQACSAIVITAVGGKSADLSDGRVVVPVPLVAAPMLWVLASMLLEALITLMVSLHKHACQPTSRNVAGGGRHHGGPAGVSYREYDSRDAFPSLVHVVMLNKFVRMAAAQFEQHQQQATTLSKEWGSVLPVARRLLRAEIRRTRNLLRVSQQEQWEDSGAGGLTDPAALTAAAGRKIGGERGGAGGLSTSSSVLQLFKPYSHHPSALTRRGLYSLAVFTSTLVTACSVLKLFSRYDRLYFSLASPGNSDRMIIAHGEQDAVAMPFPLRFVVFAFRRLGSSLFLGLKESLKRGLAYHEDRGLYLGVNILLAVLCTIPISLWTSFVGSVVRYQELDDSALGLAHAVHLPLPLRDSGSSDVDGGISTSFRTVINSGGDVRVVGRVHIEAARRILERVALGEEYHPD